MGTRAVDTAALRTMVGATAPTGEGSRPGDLQALIGGPAADVPRRGTADLTTLTGAPSRPGSASSATALSALVGERTGGESDEGWAAPELAQVGRRPLFGGRRKGGAANYLSIAVSALAVLALIGTASFAVVQRATANPADDAMVSLREREAELANETKVLQTAVDLYTASVAEASSLAESSAPVLASLQGRVESAPLSAAEAGRAALAQAASSARTVSVPTYARGSIDEKSLSEVGRAIDGVHLARETLPGLLTAARDARATIVATISSYRGQLTTLGTAIQAEAATIVAANDSAAQAFRDAVTDSAARVTAAQRAGGDGLSDMPAYAAAVDALRAENARVVAAEQEERETMPTTPRNSGGGSSDTSRDSDAGGGTNTGGSPDNANTPEPSPSPSPSQPGPEPQPEPEPSGTEEPPPVVPVPDPTDVIPGAAS
ncbi:hypothetical protein [Microbacterium trichothecenolyticum]|uniref:hypothetical protein n=1 Tax=Microbacterium trichothecenolyticum TaxID=69370 RepID=UPI0027D83EBB|nr:hypothetical protein [Microbacterium trichothecenolyticum]